MIDVGTHVLPFVEEARLSGFGPEGVPANSCTILKDCRDFGEEYSRDDGIAKDLAHAWRISSGALLR